MKVINFISYIVSLACSVFIVCGQVGVNTNNPLGVFHLDAKGDNVNVPSVTQLANDIVVTEDGNIGIGILPQDQLHIKANAGQKGFMLNDGNEYSGGVLKSDAGGFATWAGYAYGSSFALYTLRNTAFDFDGDYQQLGDDPSTTLDFNSTINNSTGTIQSLFLPKGKYLIFLLATIESESPYPINGAYFSAKLQGSYVGSVGSQYFTSDIRVEFFLSQVDFYDFTDDVHLSLPIKMLDGAKNFRIGTTPTVGPTGIFPITLKIVAMNFNF